MRRTGSGPVPEVTEDGSRPTVHRGEGEIADVARRSAPSHAVPIIAVTSVAHFVNDGVIFFVPVIGDVLAQQNHTSPGVVTAMLTIFSVVSAGGGLGVGLVSDALERRGPMTGLGIAGLAASLFAF